MRTNKGRVVYDRKKNLFRYSDLFRVCRSFAPASVLLRLSDEDWNGMAVRLGEVIKNVGAEIWDTFSQPKGKSATAATMPVDNENVWILQNANVVLLYKKSIVSGGN